MPLPVKKQESKKDAYKNRLLRRNKKRETYSMGFSFFLQKTLGDEDINNQSGLDDSIFTDKEKFRQETVVLSYKRERRSYKALNYLF